MKWISFKEEKPFLGQLIVVYDKNDMQNFNVGFYEEDFSLKTLTYYGSEVSYILNEDLIWLPLPKPPKDS